MHGTVLSSAQYQSMRNKLKPAVHDTRRQDREAQLKRLSQDKIDRCSNTLEALRKKKLMFVEEKARKEEEARQEVDRKEAEHRRVQRLEAIERANNLMYDQTDKMKYLKGAKLYADVVKTREAQVEFKRGKKEVEKKEAASYHEEIMKKVRAGEIEEEEKKQKVIDKIEIIKVQRREQVMEVRARRAAEAAEAKAIGEAMKKQAQERIEEDMAEQVRKAEMIASSNAALVIANERAIKIKAELKERENEAAARRDDEKEEIERRKKAMKALAIRSFEKKQETRQKIIEAAVKQLTQQANTEAAIATKQAEEKRAKDDAALAAKEAKREAERLAIRQSRTEQINAKREKVEAEWAQEDLMVKKQIEEAAAADAAEKAKAQNEWNNIKRLKDLQYKEAANVQRKKISERLEEINQAKILQDIGAQDDDKFAEICKEEIKKYAAEGKPVYTLLKALEQTEPTLIPARLDPSKRGKKDED